MANNNSSNKADDAMETLKRLVAEQKKRLAGKEQWTEAKRDNVRDGGMVPKPGESK